MKENIKRWIIKALEDLKIAKHELTFPEKEIASGPVCFHCQQAIEKLLKAYLVFKNTEFGKTHDLIYLLELCAKHDKDFKNQNIGNLNNYSVDIRYPDEFYTPTVKEAKAAYEIAQKIKEYILKKFNIKEDDLK